jgi:hypothetical protein
MKDYGSNYQQVNVAQCRAIYCYITLPVTKTYCTNTFNYATCLGMEGSPSRRHGRQQLDTSGKTSSLL